MATIKHDPVNAPVRLIHFTPQTRRCWCWMFVRPVLSLPGLQTTFDGQIVDIGAGSTLSEKLPQTPDFSGPQEADRWAEANRLAYVSAEIA